MNSLKNRGTVFEQTCLARNEMALSNSRLDLKELDCLHVSPLDYLACVCPLLLLWAPVLRSISFESVFGHQMLNNSVLTVAMRHSCLL